MKLSFLAAVNEYVHVAPLLWGDAIFRSRMAGTGGKGLRCLPLLYLQEQRKATLSKHRLPGKNTRTGRIIRPILLPFQRQKVTSPEHARLTHRAQSEAFASRLFFPQRGELTWPGLSTFVVNVRRVCVCVYMNGRNPSGMGSFPAVLPQCWCRSSVDSWAQWLSCGRGSERAGTPSVCGHLVVSNVHTRASRGYTPFFLRSPSSGQRLWPPPPRLCSSGPSPRPFSCTGGRKRELLMLRPATTSTRSLARH